MLDLAIYWWRSSRSYRLGFMQQGGGLKMLLLVWTLECPGGARNFTPKGYV